MSKLTRTVVHSMSGIVITITVVWMLFALAGMSRGNAEWDIIAFAGAGVALIALAGTIVWRTLAARMPWWEAAAQYAIGGGLMVWALLNHAFFGVAMTFSQAHLIVSAVFCIWNLAWVYRAKASPQ